MATKTQLREQLDQAEIVLTETLDLRVPKSHKDKINALLEEWREALSSPKSADPTWRLGTLTNPNTGREITCELKVDGYLQKGDAERTGVERADSWVEIRAPSRREALALIEAGEGTKLQASPSKPKRRTRKKATT